MAHDGCYNYLLYLHSNHSRCSSKEVEMVIKSKETSSRFKITIIYWQALGSVSSNMCSQYIMASLEPSNVKF